jgi:multiple sugar transport system substrate-binding protein
MSEHGRLSSLKEQKMRDNYGIDLVSLKGKNVKGIFKAAFADPAPYSEYDQIIGKYLSQAADQTASGSVDINTALRQAEAAANKAIAGLKAEGK